MNPPTVFISAVSSELRAYRLSLADALRGAKINVILQENLTHDGNTLLNTLEREIKSSQAAICLVGSGSGAAFPSVKEGVPYERLLPAEQDRVSHTQWEVILARHHQLHVLYFYPSDSLAPSLPTLSEGDDPALQTRFKAWLESEGVSRLEFEDHRDLAIKVLQQLYPTRSRADLASLLPPVVHGLPPSLGRTFVGREDFLVQIRQTLTQSNSTAITAAISGLGGIGKTRAAAEYAWAHQADYPGGMLMIPAATPDSQLTHLSNLTVPLGIPGMDTRPPEERRAAVITWLRAHRDWLLILDHVDTDAGMRAAHVLRGELPTGHVLLTSRLGTVPSGFLGLSLGVLSPEAATRFLLESTDGRRTQAPDDAAQAAGLARDLDGLALALTHAAAYVRRYRLSLSAYRAELDRAFQRVLGAESKDVTDHHERSTLATLEVSLSRATAGGRALLERLAFLADEPVPRFLLEVPGSDGVNQLEAEADLADYSLVTRDDQAGSFTTHRLVRAVVRRSLSEADARTRLEQALRWVDDAFVGHPQDARSWPRLLPLAEHAEVVALAAEQAGIDEPTGRLMAALGVLFDVRAQYGRAERLKRAALAIGERSLGPDHPSVATRLNNLAELLRATNRLAEAEPLYRRALAIDEASLGPDHPDVARDLNNLAKLLEATNRLAEAEPLYRRMVLIFLNFRRATGHAHPHHDTALANYAGILQDLGRTQEAIDAELRALLAEAGLEGL